MSRVGFAFAQARLHARLSRRLTGSDWQNLESSMDLSHCLDFLAKTAAASLVAPLGPDSDAHQIERALRRAWGELVGEIAGWVPPSWRAAVRWMALLPHLRPIEAWQAREALPPWAAADRFIAALWQNTEAWPPAVGAVWDMRPFAVVGQGAASPVADIWLDEMERRAGGARSFAPIRAALDPLFSRHLGIRPVGRVPGGDLDDWLMTQFRSRPQTPVSVLSFLGMAARDFERLRAALVGVAVFTGPAREKVS